MPVFVRHIAHPDADPGMVFEELKMFMARYLQGYKTYVGITVDPKGRLKGHNRGKRPWANYLTVLWGSSDPGEVEEMEQRLIVHYRRDFDINRNPEFMDNIKEDIQGNANRYPRYLYLLTDITPKVFGANSPGFRD